MCMITIAKMVQAAKAAQIQAHLAQLVPALLESLSSMEVCGSLLESSPARPVWIILTMLHLYLFQLRHRRNCEKKSALQRLFVLSCPSPVQDQRMNYVEQHAERIGVDAGRLENLRVSAAKGSIMGDTLDVCARHVDSGSLEVVVPVLSQLVKRGVGLNTQAGAARFITSLAMRMNTDLRPQSGPLLKASIPYQ